MWINSALKQEEMIKDDGSFKVDNARLLVAPDFFGRGMDLVKNEDIDA